MGEYDFAPTEMVELSAEIVVAGIGDRPEQEVVEFPADGCPELRDGTALAEAIETSNEGSLHRRREISFIEGAIELVSICV